MRPYVLRQSLRLSLRPVLRQWREFRLPENAFLLASYPKSGNTWLKMMIACAIEGKDQTFDDVEHKIPYAGCGRNGMSVNKQILMKTHETYSAAYRKGIYLVRDCRDVVVSCYFALRNVEHDLDMSSFVAKFVGGRVMGYGLWGAHVNGYLAAASESPHWLVVRYEDLVTAPERTLANILRHVGCDADEATLAGAIEACEKDKLRAKESASARMARRNRRVGSAFVREARSGGWQSHLSVKDEENLVAAFRDILHRLGYLRTL